MWKSILNLTTLRHALSVRPGIIGQTVAFVCGQLLRICVVHQRTVDPASLASAVPEESRFADAFDHIYDTYCVGDV